MGFLIALLTLVMVFDCLILIFLVLIQLPKKEAGAGVAFGASATDALFGAGSGSNVLTQITKYAATGFFVLAVVLSILFNVQHSRNASTFSGKLGQPTTTLPGAPAPAPAIVPPTPLVPDTNAATPLKTLETTNIPAVPSTNPATNNSAPK